MSALRPLTRAETADIEAKKRTQMPLFRQRYQRASAVSATTPELCTLTEAFHMKNSLIQLGLYALALAPMAPLAQAHAQREAAGLQAAFAADAGTLADKFTGLARVMA